jgi:hypothetical protein
MGKKLTLADRAEVTDVLARYCWHVDEGDSDDWADLEDQEQPGAHDDARGL